MLPSPRRFFVMQFAVEFAGDVPCLRAQGKEGHGKDHTYHTMLLVVLLPALLVLFSVVVRGSCARDESPRRAR